MIRQGPGPRPTSVDIRSVRPEEWREFRALRLRALADAPDAFGSTLAREAAEPEDSWRRRWLDPLAVTLVADQNGHLVGMAFGRPTRDYPGIAGLFGMWVEPIARRHGIGGALVGRVADWARSMGYQQMELGVTTTNEPAVAFYEKLGFVDTGERRALRDESDLTFQVMIATLDPR